MASLSSSYLFDPPSVSSINHSLVNSNSFDASPALFGNTVNPATVNVRALPEPANSIQAANSYIPGLTMNGGGSRKKRSKKYLKKIKNIASMYKMKGTHKSIRRKLKLIKSRIKRRFGLKSRKARRHSRHMRRRRHSMKGGYAQYMNNMPYVPNYSSGGPLTPSMSALANPVPIQRFVDTMDNLNHGAPNSYGHYGTGSGFPSKGSY